MANPLVSQGTLNRLLGSVIVTQYPQLNVTASYLGREALRLSWDGSATTMQPTLTGMVTSPEPYQGVTLTIHLLKTQTLAQLYFAQFLATSLLGPIVVYPDAAGFGPFPLFNCALETPRELSFAGEDPGYPITIRGTYYVNATLWA